MTETNIYIAFFVILLTLLAIDLRICHRRAHALSIREAGTWVVIWLAVAVLFNIAIYYLRGADAAFNFLTGYLVEQSLSVDNLFVFIVLFSYFGVPPALHHRTLFYGILGAVVMRAGFIFLGLELLERLHWLIYVLGGLLMVTAFKFATQKLEEIHPERNPAITFMRRFFPVTNGFHEQSFFVRENGKLHITPLFLVLLAIEISDIMFAIDSIPAILGITTDPLIVFTSNMLAVLGLRAYYFLISQALVRLKHLNLGLAVILFFVGAKIFLGPIVKISPVLSLAIVASVLGITVVASLMADPIRKNELLG